MINCILYDITLHIISVFFFMVQDYGIVRLKNTEKIESMLS